MLLDRIGLSGYLVDFSSAREVLGTILRHLAGGCLDITHSFLDSSGCALCLTCSRNSFILFLRSLDCGLGLLDLLLLLINFGLFSFRPLDVLVLLDSVGFVQPSFPLGIHVSLVLLCLVFLLLLVLSLGFDSLLIPFSDRLLIL